MFWPIFLPNDRFGLVYIFSGCYLCTQTFLQNYRTENKGDWEINIENKSLDTYGKIYFQIIKFQYMHMQPSLISLPVIGSRDGMLLFFAENPQC